MITSVAYLVFFSRGRIQQIFIYRLVGDYAPPCVCILPRWPGIYITIIELWNIYILIQNYQLIGNTNTL